MWLRVARRFCNSHDTQLLNLALTRANSAEDVLAAVGNHEFTQSNITFSLRMLARFSKFSKPDFIHDPTFNDLINNLAPSQLNPQGVLDALFYSRHMFKQRALTIPRGKLVDLQQKAYEYVREDQYNLRQLIALHFDISNMMQNPARELNQALTNKLQDLNETVSHIDLRTLMHALGGYKPQITLVVAAMKRLREMDLERYDRMSMINIYDRLLSLEQKIRARDVSQQVSRFERHFVAEIDVMTERDMAKLLKLPTIFEKTPNFLSFKLQDRAKNLIQMGHVEKELAVELLKSYISQIDNQYVGMVPSIRESGMSAIVCILESGEDIGVDDLNSCLEFCMRSGKSSIDPDVKDLLGAATNRVCYRRDQYAFPLVTKAQLLQLPEIHEETLTNALDDQNIVRKMYVLNMNHSPYRNKDMLEYRTQLVDSILEDLEEAQRTELHQIANHARSNGFRGFTNPEKYRICSTYIKRAHEVFKGAKRYSNYLRSVLPFATYTQRDFLADYVDADKLDVMVFNDLIKDCQYSLDQLTKLTDMNSDFLNSANVMNLFFLLNNDTPHSDKLKLVKLLEDKVNPGMFKSRVFAELSHEIVPFIEKFYSILPKTVQCITDFLDSEQSIYANTVLLAGLAGELNKDPSFYRDLFEREIGKNRPNYAALLKIANKIPDLEETDKQEKIYKKMVPPVYMDIQNSYRYFNLFMRLSDLDEETSEKILEALKDKMIRHKLNSYDISEILSNFTIPRTYQQRQFQEKGVELIAERVGKMFRWTSSQLEFMLASINGRSIHCTKLLEILAEKTLNKNNWINTSEFAQIYHQFADAEFPYERYFETSAKRMEEAANFRWDLVPGLIEPFAQLNFQDRQWAQDAVRALLKRGDTFNMPIYKARVLWASHMTLGADDEITQKLAEEFINVDINKESYASQMQMLTQLLHLYPSDRNRDAQDHFYERLNSYNWSGIHKRRRESISTDLKKFGFENESGIAEQKLNVPFYLPKENVAIWPTSNDIYLRNGPNMWKGIHVQHKDMIEKAGIKVLTPQLKDMNELTEEKANEIIRS